MIKAIIFDFAGVITNEGYWTWLRKNVTDIENKRDFFMSLADRADKGEFSTEEYREKLASLTGRPIQNIPQEILDGYVINPQMVDLLARLKKQLPLGLLSNFPTGWIRPLLEKYDLTKYFKTIIISSEVHMIKPEKEIFAYALSLLSTEASETLFIDDREKNVLGAKDASLQGIVFTSAEKLIEELKQKGITLDYQDYS
jgi:HAD superfamily hydrolase (TIGR01509 family)